MCNHNERLWNKCKRICLSFSQASVTIKVKETWVIVQRNCEITRMVEWKNICKILWWPTQEEFSNYLFRWNVLFFYVYLYMWCYLYKKNIYGVNYPQNNINKIRENPRLLIFSALIVSKFLFTRENWEFIN